MSDDDDDDDDDNDDNNNNRISNLLHRRRRSNEGNGYEIDNTHRSSITYKHYYQFILYKYIPKGYDYIIFVYLFVVDGILVITLK